MEKRFNKENVSDIIQDEISRLQRLCCFDPNAGLNQIKDAGQSQVINYGKYTALLQLHEDLFGTDKNFYTQF